MSYKHRIIDKQFDERMQALCAVLFVRPKGRGKTTTAKQKAKTVIRASKKKNLVDPSIVVALGISPEYFDNDYKTMAFLFESLVIRNLKIYSQNMVETFHIIEIDMD